MSSFKRKLTGRTTLLERRATLLRFFSRLLTAVHVTQIPSGVVRFCRKSSTNGSADRILRWPRSRSLRRNRLHIRMSPPRKQHPPRSIRHRHGPASRQRLPDRRRNPHTVQTRPLPRPRPRLRLASRRWRTLLLLPQHRKYVRRRVRYKR